MSPSISDSRRPSSVSFENINSLNTKIVSDLFISALYHPKKLRDLSVTEGKLWLEQLNERLKLLVLDKINFSIKELCPLYKEDKARSPITRSVLLAIEHRDVECFVNIFTVIKQIDLRGKDEYKNPLFEQIPNLFLERVLNQVSPTYLPVTAEGLTILHQACQANDLSGVKIILEQQPSLINCQDIEGRTALHLVAKEGDDYINITSKLLEHRNIDINICSKSFGAPLFSAIATNKSSIQTKMITLFLNDPRCNINLGSVYNITPFEMLLLQRIELMILRDEIVMKEEKERALTGKGVIRSKQDDNLFIKSRSVNKEVKKLTNIFLNRKDLILLPRAQYTMDPESEYYKRCTVPKTREPIGAELTMHFIVSKNNDPLKELSMAFPANEDVKTGEMVYAEEYHKGLALQKAQLEELNKEEQKRSEFKELIREYEKQEKEFMIFIAAYQKEAAEKIDRMAQNKKSFRKFEGSLSSLYGSSFDSIYSNSSFESVGQGSYESTHSSLESVYTSGDSRYTSVESVYTSYESISSQEQQEKTDDS